MLGVRVVFFALLIAEEIQLKLVLPEYPWEDLRAV